MKLRRLFSILVGCMCALPLWGADSFDALVARGLEAERLERPGEAKEAFLAADRLRPNDPVLLQKIARQLSDMTFVEDDVEVRGQLAREALEYASRAYELDPQSPEIVLSLAIIHGKLGIYAGVGDKVRYARKIKGYAEEALALKPDYAWAHHVLGQWHCSVAELGSAKRFFASLLFGGLPAASVAEGIQHLERAVALAPDEVVHRVELGFAYRQVDRVAEAHEQWHVALSLPERGLEDGPARERALAALRSGEGFRVAQQAADGSRL